MKLFLLPSPTFEDLKDVLVGSSKTVSQHFGSPGHQSYSDMEVLDLRVWRGDTRFRFNFLNV